ncbi:MAG: PIN domain-containing protein [Sphingomonadaceae bacterium]
MRFTFDSNLLVYAVDARTPDKHEIALGLLRRAPHFDAALTAQALGEFLAVIGRKYPPYYEEARIQAGRWARIFPVHDTAARHIPEAAELARRHRLQYWDSLIWTVAAAAATEIFLTEDLQDGLHIDGMTAVDPFAPENKDRLRALLSAG